jgi:V/A-type H+/Na+-transporting ATPase subunit K
MTYGIGDAGLSLALSAIGSCLGIGIASMAAIGVWKRAFIQNKSAPYILVTFAGIPLTQTIYGIILHQAIKSTNWPSDNPFYPLLFGCFTGLALGISAYVQGISAAKACDAYGETGKGAGNYLMILGIAESVAVFILVFSLMALPRF